MHDLVDMLKPIDSLMPAWHEPGPVEVAGEDVVQDIVDEGRLARAADAGHCNEAAEGKADRDIAQVVLAGVDDRDLTLLPRSADGRNLDRAPSGEILAGEGVWVIEEVLDRAAHDDMTAVLSGTGADVDDPVGYADGVLIVLDDDERIAEVAKSDKCLDEPAVIALVKADARLIENVEHPDKPGADLCREANALSLTAGEGGRRPVQRKVMQSDIDEELQSLIHLLEDATGNRGIAIGQRETAEHRR